MQHVEVGLVDRRRLLAWRSMELGVLGPLRVLDDGQEIAVEDPDARVVLASLLAHRGQVVSRAALAEAIGGDDGAVDAAVAMLNGRLVERLAEEADGWVLRLAEGDIVDADRWELALRRMRTDPGPASQAVLVAELAAWRGDAFGGLASVTTVRAEARRLERSRTDALVATSVATNQASGSRPLTPTVGRAAELAAGLRALDSTRLVTIVGPGGVGKTRLAGDLSAALERRTVVVELARVTDASGVASTVAAALDIRPTPGLELTALTGLGALDVLLVLDNCEHVIEAVVAVVPRLLSGGERLRVLTTSREALAIEGEHVLALGPLPTDGADAPAAELFRQRAVAAAPSGALDDELIAAVVARLDGLPLALEMAAARLRTMSLDDLAASISNDLDLLASSRRDVDERHRSLRQLLAWSERLLDDELREALTDFSVFAGPVRAPELAAAVRTPRPTDAIARLVDRSLVLAEATSSGVTFAALETVRGFGRQRLREAGREGTARRRHAEWFLAAVTEIDARLRTAEAPAAITRFGEVFDELRAALRWAEQEDLDMAAELVVRSFAAGRTVLRAEVVSWTADVAAALPADHAAAADVNGALADGLSTTGRLDDAVRIGTAVLDRAPSSHGAVLALEGLADAALYQGRLGDAAALSTQLRALGQERGDRYYADFGTVGVALATAYGGDPDAGLAVVADGPTCPAPSVAAWFEYTRGESILDRDPAAALAHLDRALDIARSAGDRYLTEVALLSSSTLRARTGELAGAIVRFSELLDHFGGGGDEGHLVTSLRNLVTLLVRLGQFRAAAALYGAVRDHPSSPTYGAEAERLEAAMAECASALGEAELTRVIAVGQDRPLDVAVSAATSALRNAAPRHQR